jgi:Xaa-Pro aminopeptidase
MKRIMSDIKINWKGHIEKYQTAMEDLDLDFCILTRVKSITYLSGCFVPWKSFIFLPKEGAGEPILYTVLLDVERVKAEGVLKNVQGWGPMKGYYWEKRIQKAAKKNGLYSPKGNPPRIGVEMGVDICVTGQTFSYTEAELLRKTFPGCEFVDFNEKTERIQFIKEPEEISMLRKSWPVVVPGKDWGSLIFEENMVEIAAVVFNRPGLGGLRLESPTLVTKNGAEVLPKTPFKVDYV